jgi:para-nitrobenzyl esterase
MRLTLLSIVMLWFSLVAYSQNTIDITSVKTQEGLISGKVSEDQAVKIFMGVPFAAPPVGELRWKAPQKVNPWQGVRSCVIPPASAMQATPKPLFCWSKEFMAPESPLSEDCLYLNVWTSAKTNQDKLPVIVWIHGGAFTGGSGTVPLYNGEGMARKGVVFITINYRLGIFGFFAHPDLSAESKDKVSGNYAILDMIAALKWVKQNITAFGGDPDNVTIAGQSAGAFGVNALTVSPLAKGLFHKVIAQSGARFSRQYSGPFLKDAEEDGKKATARYSIKELRALPADSLMKLSWRGGPVTDNVVVLPVYETFSKGRQHDVPVLTGWNEDDGVSFGPLASAAQFKENIQNRYGQKASKYLALFPADNNEQAARSQKLLSQLSFGWNNYSWARMQSMHGKSKAYLYYFTHVPPGEPNYGAFHSAEFGYALHTLKFWDRPFTQVDYQLEEIMSSYWANFARTGNPNAEGLPEWPAFDDKNPKVIELGDQVKATELPYRDQLYLMNEN